MKKSSQESSNNGGAVASAASSSDKRAKRRGMVLGMEAFVHRNGGTAKSITAFRKRKERKRTETAKTLRQYRKVMKQEGYEPGVGASRKRGRLDDEDGNDVANEDKNASKNGETRQEIPAATTTTEESAPDSTSNKRKRMKTNPFTKSIKKAEEFKNMAKQHQDDKMKNERQRQKRLKERKHTSRRLAQRTQRGQPIMKHMVNNLLVKLQHQNQQQHKVSK